MCVPNTGIAIIQCQGHKHSMEKRDTTVINLDVHPDQATLYKAKNDPKVAALLHSLGVKKEEQYRDGDNKKLDKLVSYTMTGTDAVKSKHFINKLAELLPGLFDNEDKELIYNIIDEQLTEAGQQKRQIYGCQYQNGYIQPTPIGYGYTITVGTCIEIITQYYIYIFKGIDIIYYCV